MEGALALLPPFHVNSSLINKQYYDCSSAGSKQGRRPERRGEASEGEAYNNYKAMQVIANPGGTNRASKKESGRRTITNKLTAGLPSSLVDDVGNDLTRLH